MPRPLSVLVARALAHLPISREERIILEEHIKRCQRSQMIGMTVITIIGLVALTLLWHTSTH